MRKHLLYFYSMILFSSLILFLQIPNVKANPLYEDFTTYTEVDPLNKLTVTSTRVTATLLEKVDDCYVYDDKGANHFSVFEHLLTVKLTKDAHTHIFVWAVSNEYGSYDDWANGAICLYFYDLDTPDLILLPKGGVQDSYAIILNRVYYLTIERLGTTCTCKIYSDDARTDLLDTLTVTCVATQFRYITAMASRDAAGALTTSGYSENLDLQEANPWVIFYHNSGGIFRVNNATIANTTEIEYLNGTILELVAIVEGNLTYGFGNFTWNGNSNISNPYIHTVFVNQTVWAYFDPITAVGYNWFGVTIIIAIFACLGFIMVLTTKH